MTENTKLLHVALQYSDKNKVEVFFQKILGLNHIKTFNLSEELSEEIFNINKKAEVVVYGNENTVFEIFINSQNSDHGYEHICIEINDKEKFVKLCKENDLKPLFIKKDDRVLLFVRDFMGYIFEVKENQKK
jgi:catechol-2,3-dioxygenase